MSESEAGEGWRVSLGGGGGGEEGGVRKGWSGQFGGQGAGSAAEAEEVSRRLRFLWDGGEASESRSGEWMVCGVDDA